MNKSEIALQLTLSKLNDLKKTVYDNLNPCAENHEVNLALAKEIAEFYNCIYENIK
ncbi:hypothetical protein FACS1894188_09900 [Clostridia bacterium]|nr:hypothetical protein FACS1894188_09900 [Clostridia bacterium]